jgi:UDP-glucose 4-epimerase
MSNKRVLVTGGAGFIGSHLVERLVASRADVAVADDLSRGDPTWVPRGVALHRLDVCDGEALRGVVTAFRPTAVVHLAAVHFIPEVDGAPDRARRVNVDGTHELLEVLAAAPPEVVLFASSGAVYPDRRGAIPESCPVGPLDLYGRTKVEGERAVAQFAADTGTRCLIARLFNVIGMRETNPHVVPELVGQLRRGASPVQLGALDRVRDYTDVVDVAGAIAQLLQAPVDERLAVVNVGSGAGTSVRELVATCERILGRAIAVEIDPGRQRTQDRIELVADVEVLRSVVSRWPSRTVEQTLEHLLTMDDESSFVRTTSTAND